MHNTDRTQQYMESAELNPGFSQEYPQEFQEYQEYPQEYPQEYQENPQEYPQEYPQGYAQEYPQGEYPQAEYQHEEEIYGEIFNAETGAINETFEMSMAAELLAVNSERGLDQFIGRFLRRAGISMPRFRLSGLTRLVGGALRGVARAVLPKLGGALGSLIPIPGVGTALGAAAGHALGRALRFETGTLSQEDRNFELARRTVRIAIEQARAIDELPQGEYAQAEIGSILSGIASRILPGLASRAAGPTAGGAAALLAGNTGQAASGAQATGAGSAAVNFRGPLGLFDFSASTSGGGQVTGGTGVGLNTNAPGALFTPSPANQVLPPNVVLPPVPPIPNRTTPIPPPNPRRIRPRTGTWVRDNRNLIVLNAF